MFPEQEKKNQGLKSSTIDFQTFYSTEIKMAAQKYQFTLEIKLHSEIFPSDPQRNNLQPYPKTLICPFEINIHFSTRVNQVWKVIFLL